MNTYVHGYSEKEGDRLHDQANTLDELLHGDSVFPDGSRILEVGCGVGSQTRIIAAQNPRCHFTSVDISEASLQKAAQLIQKLNIKNVEFQKGDIFNLDFQNNSFDHVFVCFVLEHLSAPVQALLHFKNVLKPEGTIMVIEGDHGSAFFHPYSEFACKAIQTQVELQRRAGGNAMIGRELFPLLSKTGYHSIRVSPRMVYADASRPDLVNGFTKKTFTAMIEGVKDSGIKTKIITKDAFDQGIKALCRTTEADGIFCYTFFKATAVKQN